MLTESLGSHWEAAAVWSGSGWTNERRCVDDSLWEIPAPWSAAQWQGDVTWLLICVCYSRLFICCCYAGFMLNEKSATHTLPAGCSNIFSRTQTPFLGCRMDWI